MALEIFENGRISSHKGTFFLKKNFKKKFGYEVYTWSLFIVFKKAQ